MNDSFATPVICQDPDDSSRDIIIDLPPDVLAAMDVGLGDILSIELVDGSIVLKPIREINTRS